MAFDWIKVRINLPTDPRVVFVASKVKKPAAHVVGACAWLWMLADEHSTDGTIVGYTTASVDRMVGIRGFCSALVAIKDLPNSAGPWLEVGSGFLRIPDFHKHNGASAKARATEQARKRAQRAGLTGVNVPVHLGQNPDTCPVDPARPLACAGAPASNSHLSLSGSVSFSEGGSGETKPTAADFGKPPPGLSGPWTHFELERVYAVYPKKCKPIRGREAISRACVALVLRGVADPVPWLIERVKAYADAVAKWPEKDRQWVLDPHNWFDAGSYDDDPATWARAPRGHDDAPTTKVGKGGF